MKIIGTTFEKLPRERLVIGFEGENLRATVRIDCASVFAEYPNATPTLIVKPLFADTYPVVVDRNGTDVDWLITSEILSFSGDGEIQLVFYKDQVICKSAVSKIRVCRSLQVTGDMPDPVAQWIDDANRKLAEVDAQIVELEGMVDTATDAATRAEQSASTASTKAEQAAGSAATATAKATEAQTAATTATAKAAEAQTAAQTATSKAYDAAESERIATAKAGEATTAAGTATAKAEQATEAAQTATEKAGDASASARAAQASATNAASSATAASASETAAKASETAASTSASQAGTSAQTAGTAAQAATQKAAEASQSATNAETFAGTATTKAEEAAESAQAAQDAKTVVAETAEQLADSLEQIEQNTQDIAEHEQYAEATYATKTDLYKKADIIHNTASGAIASFPDGANGHPVDELEVAIEPVQDLHGYENPWPAGGGNNLWGDIVMANDMARTVGASINTTNKTVSISTGGNEANMTDGVVFKENTQYTFIFDGQVSSYGNLMFSYTDGTNDRSLGRYFLVGANVSAPGKTVAGLYKRDYLSTTTIYYEKAGLFEGVLTASQFSPYSNICPITGWDGVQIVVSPTTDAADGQTYDITLPTEAGTVYGGELTVNADGSGSLVVDSELLTLDGSTIKLSGTFGEETDGRGYYFTGIGARTRFTTKPMKSNVLRYSVSGVATQPLYSFPGASGSANTCTVKLPKTIATKDDANAWLQSMVTAGTPVQVTRLLTIPLTYTLTASQIRTLLGTNHIWSDAGDVSVIYKADTKLYIDNKITQAIAAALNS